MPPVLSSSCASNNNVTYDMIIHSRGFLSQSVETPYTPLDSDKFCDAILGLGHTFKNAEEFCNAIYKMSLSGRFQYKYIKKSPKHVTP